MSALPTRMVNKDVRNSAIAPNPAVSDCRMSWLVASPPPAWSIHPNWRTSARAAMLASPLSPM